MDAYAAPAGDAFRAPKCTPVTLYQSEEKPPAESASSQLAACEKALLAYAIKGGKIRVLARGRQLGTLFRGHSQRIVDLALAAAPPAPPRPSPRAARAAASALWTVREGPGGDEVAHERGPEPEIAGAVRRVAPRPRAPPALAVAGEAGAVVVTDARDAASRKQLPRGGSSCHDVGWSADGAALATAAADGRVRVFDDRLELVADCARRRRPRARRCVPRRRPPRDGRRRRRDD